MNVLAGSSNPQLAEKIASLLQTSVVPREISLFANGEKRVIVDTGVRGKDVLIVQAFSRPVDEHVVETLLLADAVKRAGAKNIRLFLPWFGYSFQDKVFREGEPLSAEVLARVLDTVRAKEIFFLDLHNSFQIPRFFKTKTRHLSAGSVFAQYIQENHHLENALVVSPDYGGMMRSQQFAQALQLPIAVIKKRRDLNTRKIVSSELEGDVRGKTVFVFDDAIFSGGTTVEISQLLKENGATAVHFFATHGLFTGTARETLANSAVDNVVTTNSLPQEAGTGNITVLDISPVLVENISR